MPSCRRCRTTGGDKPRPYEKPESVAVGAAISRPRVDGDIDPYAPHQRLPCEGELARKARLRGCPAPAISIRLAGIGSSDPLRQTLRVCHLPLGTKGRQLHRIR